MIPRSECDPTKRGLPTATRSHWRAIALVGVAVGVGGAAATTQGPQFKYSVHDMARPQPTIVTVGETCLVTPPSDAIVLFGGTHLDAWTKAWADSPAQWKVADGVATIAPGSGDIQTKQSFGDCQFHLEWMIPKELRCEGQHGCNSGIFFLSQYEVQILNSSGNKTYADGMAGSLYGQYPPLVNACRAQGEWNSYDIVFRGPRFDAAAGTVRAASVTLLFNGVLAQDDVEMLGATAHAARAKYTAHPEAGPIRIQDHGDAIKFRNIWIRPLGAPQIAE